MRNHIYLSPPDCGPAEADAVQRALASGWVAPLGPEVDAFEAEVAARAGRRHAVALSSGTAALHLALLGVGVRPGDVVVTSTMTFVATAGAVTYCGAEPVFVDCDETGNMDPGLLAGALADQRRRRRRVGAVLPVDLLGKVAAYEELGAVAADHGVPVVSDAAESFGALRGGRPAGSFGRAAAISFNGNKIMTTSGGGALVTDDGAVAARARYLATQARQPVAHYEHTEIGYNYRLSNLLAALGRAQLARLDEMIERRRALRLLYRDLFSGVPGTQIFGSPDGADIPGAALHRAGHRTPVTRDNFWLTTVLVDPAVAGWTPADLVAALARADIEARPMWKPLHRQPVFAGRTVYGGTTAERLFARGVTLPSGSSLDLPARARVVDVVRAFLERHAPVAEPASGPLPLGRRSGAGSRPLRAAGAP
ncbi:dTDP-4-amino-4,6-dideoxygalactose transaminase [Georgenia soli]|uniref:dTDP-4-amino-4,6-dideoxygalactose transaminase n=1 Tax=Georgenia soli TaxID=638953 RepID=A0A2A9ELF9_9MICO|nr:aminotransferase class I/II-fold pyridoxal phosphate-dependent enzyme [Georgenia soli]PFG39102.1 dTDP-4-amino-4,6-dideoxygalactose transaminase [Georgenia soli]